MLKQMKRVSRWTEEDEEMGDWYHFVSMVNGTFNTPPVQLMCILFMERLEQKVLTKGDTTETGFQVFAGNSFKHKMEKAIPSKTISSEHLMSRR